MSGSGLFFVCQQVSYLHDVGKSVQLVWFLWHVYELQLPVTIWWLVRFVS